MLAGPAGDRNVFVNAAAGWIDSGSAGERLINTVTEKDSLVHLLPALRCSTIIQSGRFQNRASV